MLEARAHEVQRAVLARVETISEELDEAGPEYRTGLHASVSSAIEFAAGALKAGKHPPPPMPESLARQARLAAYRGIGLDAVLRRYVAGRSIFDAFLIEAAHRDSRLPRDAVPSAMSPLGPAFDQLIEYVAREFRAGLAARAGGSQRLRDRIGRVLSGETNDLGDVRYSLAAHHLAIVSEGRNATPPQELGRYLDSHLLHVEVAPGLGWSWLGTRHPVDERDLLRAVEALWEQPPIIGIGESLEGVDGFRLTHEQARIAQAQGHRLPESPTRYVDVAVAHAVQQDRVLSSTLHRVYIAPLEEERDGGAVLRDTLRAYLSANRSGVSAAAMLGVTRQTVAARLRLVEERLSRPLTTCATEVELALLAHEPSSRRGA